MTIQTWAARISSVLIKLLSYIFLRWVLVPELPPVIFTLFAVNVPSVVLSHLAASKYDVVQQIDVTVTDTVETDDDGEHVENKKLTVAGRVVVKEKSPRLWRTLLLGTPSPSRLASLLAVLVNAALVAMVADRLYSEHAMTAADLSFVRVGFVSDSTAKFLIREPDQAKMPVTLEFRLKDPQPPFESPVWQEAGGTRWTNSSSDYTAVLTVRLRWGGGQRVYEWRTSNNHSGEFVAAPKAGKTPDLFDGRFTFVATSCMLSRVPYNPLDHPLAIPGLRHLARVLPSLGAQFMMFMGDFIYIDVPRRWGTAVEDYRQKYRQVYASPDWAGVGQNLSWIHVLDDHEIANDWSAQQTGLYAAAVDPYRHYHLAANPPPPRRADTARGLRTGATYSGFAQGPASFFLLDTRTYRSSNSEPYNSTDKTMLGAEQLADVLAYLQRPEPRGVRWKILVSSVPFTKNWRVNRRDTWGGFLAERQILLEAMWDAGLHGTGVVILSGDRHEFGATRFPPPADSERWPADVAVHEFSASPLNQFYSPLPTYFQTDDEDVKIKYINGGNSKFGAVTIHPPRNDTTQSTLEYRLFIDGVEAWNTTIQTPEPAEGFKTMSLWDRIMEYAS